MRFFTSTPLTSTQLPLSEGITPPIFAIPEPLSAAPEGLEPQCMGSLEAYKTSQYLTKNTPLTEPPSQQWSVQLPDKITPANAHEFPELVREIEEIERDCHQAKNPWSRGVVSLFILAHSGKFHEYVTQNGLLSDAGREFLSTLEGSQREIDPAIVQRNGQDEKADGSVAPKDISAAAPLQAASNTTSPSESDMRDMKDILASVPSDISPGLATLLNIPIVPFQIPAAIALLSHRDVSMRLRAIHYLTSAAMKRHDISAALPLLSRMIDETMPFCATVARPFWAPATEAIKAAREHEASSAQAYDLLIDMLGRSAENEWRRANAVLFGDFLHGSASEQRNRAVAALKRAERHPYAVVKQRVRDLLKEHEAEALRKIMDALKPYGFLGPIDLAAGPGRLAEQLQAEPELIPLAIKQLDSSEDRMAEAVASAFGIVAAAGGDVTPAIGRMFNLCFSDRFSRGPETSIAQRAFGDLIQGTKLRKAALDLLEPKLAERRLTERSTAYNVLRTSARGQRAMDMLAKGLGDEAHGIRNDVREALKVFAVYPKTSIHALYATADMLFKLSPENRKLAAEVFDFASDKVPMVASDMLVGALATSQIADTLSSALYKAALRKDSRRDVLAALMGGIAKDVAEVRSKSASILGRLVAQEESRAAAIETLAPAQASKDARVRAGIALALGHAAKSAALGQTEIGILEKLRADGDKTVKDNAAWALKNAKANGGSDVKAGATSPAASPAADIKEPEAKTEGAKVQAAPPPVETPRLDEPGLKRLLSEGDESIWSKARPGVVKALLELDGKQRHDLMKGEALAEYDVTALLRAANLYQEIASQVALSGQEIQLLLKKWPQLMPSWSDKLESVLNTARTARGRNGFLSRDVYFVVMDKAVKGEFGKRTADLAREHLKTSARKEPRARDLLAGAEQSAAATRAQDTAGPKAVPLAPEQKTDPLLDPASLVEVFRNSYEDRHGVAGIATCVEELLARAKTNDDMARKVSGAMRQAVMDVGYDLYTLQRMLNFFYLESASRGLLTEEDSDMLKGLCEKFSLFRIVDDIHQVLDAGGRSAESEKTTPRPATAPQPVASPKEGMRVEPPSPERLAFINKMAEAILHGNQGKAVADWAKLVGEGKAETHALPILLEVLAAVNERSMAVDRLANAIAKPTNWPEKKLGILVTALSSNEPRVRAGAAMVFGELGRFPSRITFVELAHLQARLAEDEDERVRNSAEAALIAIGKNPVYRDLVVAEVSATAEAVKGKKLESLKKVLEAI